MEKFLEALKNDSKLMEEFKSQETPEGLYSVAKPYIGDMSQADFVMSLQELSSLKEKVQTGEMSEDDLLSASGGGFINSLIKGIMGIAPVAGYKTVKALDTVEKEVKKIYN